MSSAAKKAAEQLEATETPKKAVARGGASNANDLSREIESVTLKLNNAARAIVEVLDGDLPEDLERRFKKNETEVYVQHLAESRNKKQQRAIATRYENDRAVRTSIDSYVRLFERLLDSVAEAPKGNQMLEGCLASEAGKIYMMLAEASGRIAPN
jgi:hypothetical protein